MDHRHRPPRRGSDLHPRRSNRPRSWPFRAAPLQVSLFLVVVASARAGIADDDPQEFAPRGLVVDLNRKPIPGAQVTLHRWDGVMSPALQTTTTDEGGRFEFPPRPDDAH